MNWVGMPTKTHFDMKTVDYKENPIDNSKAEFKLKLRHGECSCGNVMWCKWGCIEQTYPVGMRHYEHPLWTEVATVYLDALVEGKYNLNDEWTQELITELEKRGHRI